MGTHRHPRGAVSKVADKLGVSMQRASQIMANSIGLCARCFKKNERMASLCSACVRRARARWRSTQEALGRTPRRNRCRTCLRQGHNSRSCPRR
jgi:hypothetical protein